MDFNLETSWVTNPFNQLERELPALQVLLFTRL